jgi:hypothetical protein
MLTLFNDATSLTHSLLFQPSFAALAAVTAASMVKNVCASRLTRSDALDYKSPIVRICSRLCPGDDDAIRIDMSCLFIYILHYDNKSE